MKKVNREKFHEMRLELERNLDAKVITTEDLPSLLM